MTGKRFGKLIVNKFNHSDRTGKAFWSCQCDCGNTTTVNGMHLRSGHTTSCGKSCGKTGLPTKKRKYEANLDNVWYSRYSWFMAHAEMRDHCVEISPELFQKISSSSCAYCGGFSKKGYNGIDRKNSKLGYTIENAVSCCRICNLAKNEYTVEEFLSWVKRICKFQFGNKLND